MASRTMRLSLDVTYEYLDEDGDTPSERECKYLLNSLVEYVFDHGLLSDNSPLVVSDHKCKIETIKVDDSHEPAVPMKDEKMKLNLGSLIEEIRFAESSKKTAQEKLEAVLLGYFQATYLDVEEATFLVLSPYGEFIVGGILFNSSDDPDNAYIELQENVSVSSETIIVRYPQ